MNTRTILSVAAPALVSLALAAPAAAQIKPAPSADEVVAGPPPVPDDHRLPAEFDMMLARGPDGSVRFEAIGLDDMLFAILIASKSPAVSDYANPDIAILADRIRIAEGPVRADGGWTSEPMPADIDGPLFVQLLVVRHDGGIAASGVLVADGDRLGPSDGDRVTLCDRREPDYDGPALEIEMIAVHYFQGEEPGRAVRVTFEAPSSGYWLDHLETVVDTCGEDLYVTLDEPQDGDVVLPAFHTLRITAPLTTHAGRVRVFVGRLQRDGDALYYEFQLAEVFDADVIPER